VVGTERFARDNIPRIESSLEGQMAIPGRDFIARFDAGEIHHGDQCRCADCRTPIQETLTGNRHTDHGRVCSDCYFHEMGEWVATHPIEPFDPHDADVVAE
jgi:hypothetical protein